MKKVIVAQCFLFECWSICFFRNQKLQEFIDLLISDPSYQMKSPGVTTSIGGKNKTLYMSKVASIEEATR